MQPLRRRAPLPTWTAIAEQRRLRALVEAVDPPRVIRTVAGADVHYPQRLREPATAAVVVCDAETLEPVERVTAGCEVAFPYVPGLLASREAPPILAALAKVRSRIDLVLVDGHGIAHPERFGLACHLGVVAGLATVGVAKSVLTGVHERLPAARGSSVPLSDGGELIGAVVRTRSGVRPVYVSVGHRVSLETAVRVVLACSPRFRIPEPIRHADRLARARV